MVQYLYIVTRNEIYYTLYLFPHTWHLHTPGQANDLLAVDMHIYSHNLSVNCTFLCSFQGVAYCEIKLIDPTFTHLEIGAQSQERASAGGSVLINNITLNASTVYLYNVSAVLEDENTPPVVVIQGIISTPSTSELCTWLTILLSKCTFSSRNYVPFEQPPPPFSLFNPNFFCIRFFLV